MPILTGVINSETVSSETVKTDLTKWPVLSTVSVATLKQLHTELAAVGLPVLGAEATDTPQFGSETENRIRAFQKLHGLPVTGAVDPTTGGVMALAAMVTTESDPSKLRAGLRAAQGKLPNSPQYDYMLFRSAILAGDYDLAVKVRLNASDVGLSAGGVLDIPTASPQVPEVPFPENFYTCRYELMSQDLIVELRTKAPAQLTARIAGQPDVAGAGGAPSAADDLARQTVVALRPRDDPNGDPPGTPPVPPPQPPTPPDQHPKALADSARAWLEAVEAWQFGNAEFAKQRYASAVAAYNACQQATLSYFALFPDYQSKLSLTTPTLAGRMDDLVFGLASNTPFWSDVWTHINFRRQLLSLAELGQLDWISITRVHGIFQLLEGNLAGKRDPLPPTNPLPTNFRKALMDARLVIIAAVLVPLARAEANRLRRQYAAALEDLTRFQRRDLLIPNSNPPKTVPAALACEFIEYPFARLLTAETLLDQAEAQYKARLSIDDEPDATKKAVALARLKSLADDFTSRHIPSGGSSVSQPFQNLVAALTYSSVLESQQSDGEYLSRAKQAADSLYAAVTSAVDNGDVTSMAFQSLGQTMTVPTIGPIGSSLPGLTNGTHPHEPFLQFNTPEGQQAMREKNPRVYAVLLAAQARLLQMWSGFNYLGYRDDYLPPWRFQFLLDRSRYFAEHAKNAQRDYLNFLSNAENEEMKELSAAQNVELEKANVQIETARVDQAAKEVAAAKQSKVLAEQNAKDAKDKLDDYKDFDSESDFLDVVSTFSSIAGGIASAVITGGATAATSAVEIASGVGAVFHGFGALSEASRATSQRELEIKNLERAAAEAAQASRVATAQLEVAKASQVVTGLQRQAALLRHEFALQSLQFMRNRVLNTEQWYRLAGAIRSVSDTYLRYAIETAFLAQQAYNFEGDRRLNVIRFDYDLSDVGGMLAADFLLRDLDTLEQDLIVTQKTRLQHVRYLLSLAREFPDLLHTLGETGEGTLSMRLERLERHFPGLFNLRIDSVDVQPVALMDTTRTSIELTHLGTGMIRLKAQPGASPLNTTDLAPNGDWLGNAGADWPVKVHVSGPEASFFSGLSRQEAASPGTITVNERGAFEGLPAASSWRIDMSMSENQVVTGTLADMIITFNASGYHDPELRAAVKAAKPQTTTLTSLLSAQNVFPDAFYDFTRTGRMVWKVPREMLTLNGDMGRLRNIGFSLRPGAPDAHFSRLMTRLRVNFRVNDTPGASGAVTLFTAIPETLVTQTAPMTLTVRAAMNGATELAWDFGDGTPILRSVRSGTAPIAPAEGTHTYANPGRYVIKLRCVQNSSLSEFRVSLSVSRNHKLGDPLIVSPSHFTFDPATKAITITTGGAVQQAGRLLWRVGDLTAEGNSATFKLKPGNYTLEFAAVRKLNFRACGDQRFVDGAAPLPLRGLSAATNRSFDLNGNETNNTGTPPLPARNELAKRLFDKGAISPEDDWTFELIPEEILGLPAGTAIGAEELDLSEIQDAVLSMEYEITPTGPSAL
jgi:peptidoglycan hydrolase-like protein with peptidoglycan-binding domain